MANLNKVLVSLERSCQPRWMIWISIADDRVIRISGIDEVTDENTDEIVLQLANRLDVELNPSDIDRSHRVGARKSTSAADAMDTDRQPILPREIIVKFKSYQLAYHFLKVGKPCVEIKKVST